MGNKLRRVLMAVCAIVLVLSVVQLGRYYFAYKKGDAIYNEARGYILSTDVPSAEDTATGGESTGGGSTGGKSQAGSKAQTVVQFDRLKEVNADIFAWIRITGTKVDYPVLLGLDNAYYLSHAFDKRASSYGSIFMEQYNQPDFSDAHTILYGHNMKNRAMFGALQQFQGQDFFDTHKEITIFLPDGQLTYEIFSVYTASVVDSTYDIVFQNQDEFAKMLRHMQESSVIAAQQEPTVADHILTLSTCTPTGSTNYRFVVNAVLIADTRESASNANETQN